MISMRLMIAVALLPPLAALPAGAQDANPNVSMSAHYALETGRPFSAVSTVKFASIDVSMTWRVAGGQTWDLELPVTVTPVALLLHNLTGPAISIDGALWVFGPFQRVTSRGMGVKPVGIRAVKRIGRSAVYVGLAGGAISFDRPVPAENSHRFNLLGDLDAGLRLPLGDRHQVNLGYRFNHLSNANRGEINPGIDSHMLSMGVSVRR